MNATTTEAMIARMTRKGWNPADAARIIAEADWMSPQARAHHLHYYDAITTRTAEKMTEATA